MEVAVISTGVRKAHWHLRRWGREQHMASSASRAAASEHAMPRWQSHARGTADPASRCGENTQDLPR